MWELSWARGGGFLKMTLRGGCSSKPWMQSEMIMHNTRDKIVPAELERVKSHHKHPTIIEHQATTTHQQPQYQQPHKITNTTHNKAQHTEGRL